MKQTRKAAIYVTSQKGLLAFSHADHPEVGLQVPSGTIGKDESPRRAAVRELYEESGLSVAESRLEAWPKYFHDMRPFRDEIQERYPFHVHLDNVSATGWSHWERHPDGNGEAERFDFGWISFENNPDQQLAVGQGEPVRHLSLGMVQNHSSRLEYAEIHSKVLRAMDDREQRITSALAKLFPNLDWPDTFGSNNNAAAHRAVIEHAAYLAKQAFLSGDEPDEAERLLMAAFRVKWPSKWPVVVDSRLGIQIATDAYESALIVSSANALKEAVRTEQPRYSEAINIICESGFEKPFLQTLGVIIKLETRDILSATNSYTLSGLPGTVFCDWINSDLRLAETVIHESIHNWLNWAIAALEIRGLSDRHFWSPWRHKERPARGIIQGAFVFSLLCQFFARCAQTPNIDPVDLAYANARMRVEHKILAQHLATLSEALEEIKHDALRFLIAEELNRALNLVNAEEM